MQQNYDIRFQRPEPTSKEVAKHQDFDALLKQFQTEAPSTEQTQPDTKVIAFRRRPYLYYATGAAAAIALLVFAFQLFTDGSNKLDETAYFANRPYIDPPATANVPDLVAAAVLDPEKDQRVPLEDGELVFSHTALFSDRGQAIKRPVQVHYRQMDEVTDYFLAGLPLSYLDDEAQQHQLDAAVVLDVYATAAGERLTIAPDESVAVLLNTQVTLKAGEGQANYQAYRLDTAARRWVLSGPVTANYTDTELPADLEVVQNLRRLESEYAARLAAVEAQRSNNLPPRPIEPSREIGNNATLELDFINGLALAPDSDVNPEDLERLNSRGIWEILPETGPIDNRAFSVEWEQVRLQRLAGERYELVLINPQRQEKLIIKPILLDDSNYQEARERYEIELASYEAALASQSSSVEAKILAILNEREAALADARKAIEETISAMSLAEQQALLSRNASFAFDISEWGLYAVARNIEDLPDWSAVSFASQTDLAKQQAIYLTDGLHKTIYRGVAQADAGRLPSDIDMLESATIWLVDEQGQLSIAEPTEEASDQLEIKPLGPLPNSANLVKQKLSLR